MSSNKRIVLAGATGFIGRHLYARLREQGYELVVLARNPDKAAERLPGSAELLEWQAGKDGPWSKALDGAYAVICLAGASVFGHRWTASYKQQIRDSRVQAIRGLVEASLDAKQAPKAIIYGSAIGYYGYRDDTILDESAPAGSDFLAQVCIAGERELEPAQKVGVRTVAVRTGLVLDQNEGALPQMLLPFRFFVGGPFGSGDQWISWIHRDDEVELLRFALENEQISGALNVTAPEPATNREFSATLGRVYATPSWLTVPSFALKAALGDFADSVLQGQRVVPAKALEAGYQFRYPHLPAALRQILG
jgi:uncharacterized protein (TIGR01777 family)